MKVECQSQILSKVPNLAQNPSFLTSASVMAAVVAGGGVGLLLENRKPGPPFVGMDEANLKLVVRFSDREA